jgi:hypothetical protein
MPSTGRLRLLVALKCDYMAHDWPTELSGYGNVWQLATISWITASALRKDRFVPNTAPMERPICGWTHRRRGTCGMGNRVTSKIEWETRAKRDGNWPTSEQGNSWKQFGTQACWHLLSERSILIQRTKTFTHVSRHSSETLFAASTASSVSGASGDGASMFGKDAKTCMTSCGPAGHQLTFLTSDF